jgi:hypothetical protein
LDGLLEGGLYSGELIELEGEVASGKTQICLAAAATTAMNGHRVLFIDTSGSFCPNRILGLTGLDADEELDPARIEFLSLITVKKVFDIHGLVEVLDSTYRTMTLQAGSTDPAHTPHLIIVDSLAAVAQPALSSQHAQGQYRGVRRRCQSAATCLEGVRGKEPMCCLNAWVGCSMSNSLHSLADMPCTLSLSLVYNSRIVPPRSTTAGHALLSYVGRMLLRIANECALATMVTNFTLQNRHDGDAKPALGLSWSGVPSTRLWFRRYGARSGLLHILCV